MSTDTTNNTSPTGPYTPVSSEQDIYNQFSWVLNGDVEDVNYVLIVVATMIVVMSYYNLQLNDTSNISGSLTLMSNDVTTINNELSTLQSAIYYTGDDSEGTDGYEVDTTIFTKDDADALAGAFTDLFYSDSSSSFTWDDMAITDPQNGTTYYLQPNGTWSTTAFTGENSVTINGYTFTPADYGLTGDSSVSDAGLYMMANAVYTVDIDVFNGNEIDVDTTFPTDSEYTNGNDPVMSSLDELWNDFTAPVEYDNSSTENSGEDMSLAGGIAEYDETGNMSDLWDSLIWMGNMSGSDTANGEGSQLSVMIQEGNNAITQINNMSTLETNSIQEFTQEISTMNSIAQAMIQDGSQAIMNSVNSQKV
ncbi:MAG: hypothetical protein ChlgKO_06760 [Chlamydiales bacterium]